MKKICVKPNTKKIALALEATKILNDFLSLGFKTRKSFIVIVQDYLPEFKDYQNLSMLETFWLMRVQNKVLNEKLATVIDLLKNEELKPIENEA